MSRGLNHVQLIGNLGAAPELRTTEAGDKVATLSVATNESWKDKQGNKVERTEWHRVILWRGLAEVAEKYLDKGKQVAITGRLKTRKWVHQDGTDRYTTEIVATEMLMLGTGDGSGSRPPTPPPPGGDLDDEIPF